MGLTMSEKRVGVSGELRDTASESLPETVVQGDRTSDVGMASEELNLARLPPILTVQDLAALLRLKPKGVYSLVEARRIPFVRISNRVRFFRQDVISWLRENRVPAIQR